MSIMSTLTDIVEQARQRDRFNWEKEHGKDVLDTNRSIASDKNELDETLKDKELQTRIEEGRRDRGNRLVTGITSGISNMVGGFLGGRALGNVVMNKLQRQNSPLAQAERLFQQPSKLQQFGTKLKQFGDGAKRVAPKLGVAAAASQLLTSTPLNKRALDNQSAHERAGELAALEERLSKGRIPYKDRQSTKDRIEQLRGTDIDPALYREGYSDVLKDDVKRVKKKRAFK